MLWSAQAVRIQRCRVPVSSPASSALPASSSCTGAAWQGVFFHFYFVSSSLPFGEEAVVAPSLGSGPPCLGVVGLSSCSEICEQALLESCAIASCPAWPPSLLGVHWVCFELRIPQMLDLIILALELHAGDSQCRADALSKWFPSCLFSLTLTVDCLVPSRAVLGSSV